MKLVKYRVTKFRSVQDSGWIDLDSVNALLGENESGKTNLLLPLWKLKPAADGAIDLLADAPRNEYSEIRVLPDEKKPIFISAIFECTDNETTLISKIAKCPKEWTKTIKASRRFDGKYFISFPNANLTKEIDKAPVAELIEEYKKIVQGIEPNKTDIKVKAVFIEQIDKVRKIISEFPSVINKSQLDQIIELVDAIDIVKASKTGGFIQQKEEILEKLNVIHNELNKESPDTNPEARTEALKLIPNFIYYSNYGNLDSQIYLPQVIANLGRTDIGAKEIAKSRTLKVLFEFVKLKPQEILDLGKDFAPGSNPNSDQIDQKGYEKKERNVLLDSAGASLTKSFAKWWNQGNYVFRFAADGDYFRIWVSDSLRTDPIELENRSTGLQWFFSFFLVFLNEKTDTHFGSILLLDEPGITLHPMAQKDLFKFFEALSIDNQILYTTHSPFLMDSNKLDQVKAVYIDDIGYSCVSSDLRARANYGNESEQKAVFPVHSALGLSVSDVLFIGCKILLVEGPSDQYYLGSIKNILISKKIISPTHELLFLPAGGTKGIKSTCRILSYDEENYPSILLDGDSSGVVTRTALLSDMYSGKENKIHMITDYYNLPDAEVEDFVDTNILRTIISRYFRGTDDFIDIYDDKKAIIPQIKRYVENSRLELPNGWKVEIAREYKKKTIIDKTIESISSEKIDMWKNLFEKWLENA